MKPGGIFLLVAVSHGEGGQIGAVERVIGFAAHHRNITLVQRKGRASRNLFLRVLDKSIERLAQRSKPQPEVDEFGVL